MTASCHTRFLVRDTLRFLFVLVVFLWARPVLASDGQGGHWALAAVEKHPVPEGAHPVDHFIRTALEEAGLGQNPAADRYTLLRRATLDLTGLPPTREEIEAFAGDSSPGAFAKLVDRLLASPHYGERWGRHWLDVARYVQGEIKVPGVDEIDLAAPYRDYVVRSFNADKPYDRFLSEQLAGDLLSESSESSEAYLDRIVAPAFLSIGQWFDECTDPNKLRLDIVDEQISTATRAFLAMDFACSRCHDHKHDPVPTRDYYALAGIFRSTEITDHFAEDWKDGRPRAVQPLTLPEERRRADAIEMEIEALRNERFEALARFREKIAMREAFSASEALPGERVAFEAEDFAGHKNLKTIAVGGITAVASRRRLDQWVRYRLVVSEPGDYTLLVRYAAADPAPVAFEVEGETLPERVLGEPTYGETQDHFRWEAIHLSDVETGSLHLRFKVDRHEPFPVIDQFRFVAGHLPDDGVEWRRMLGKPTVAEARAYLREEEKTDILRHEEEIRNLEGKRPQFPSALAVADAPVVRDLPVHIGGDVYRTAEEPVPRGVPGLADHLIQTSFPVPDDESGRVQFAAWLAHPDHPLTARVMVNRLWHWHFGTGLVRTTDDFGRLGSPPTHPELLDWLAAEFIESGWSVKHMHRIIMSSATYRASSHATAQQKEADADGLLLSRFPVRRLEVEAIYDSMLTSIGKVPRQPEGTDLNPEASKDRALYILTSSRSPMGLGIEIRKMFPLFGFDPSGRPMHARDTTLTPNQSLWWLNNPLPRYYAAEFARQLIETHSEDAERALAAHETLLGRPPDKERESVILDYVSRNLIEKELSEEEAWTRAVLGLLSSRTFSHQE